MLHSYKYLLLLELLTSMPHPFSVVLFPVLQGLLQGLA